MKNILLRGQTKHHVYVGQAEVGVNKHHLLAKLRKANGKIDRDIGLAYAALA